MKFRVKILIALIFIALALLVLKTKQAKGIPVYESQQQEAGGITMSVAPILLSPQESPTFEIVLDTHSVDLSFDLASASKLEDANKTPYGQASWVGDPPGGHHRKGVLTFSQVLRRVDAVTLIFSDIAGTDWKFQFDI